MTLLGRKCPRCEKSDYGTKKRSDGIRHEPTTERPDTETLEDWLSESGAESTDGCWVEPDGTCSHGHQSWLRVLGLI